MDGEIIDRTFDFLTVFQCFQVFDHEICVKSVWMVVVQTASFFIAHLVVGFVVIIVFDDGDLFDELGGNLVGESGFAAAGTAGDSYD